MLLPAGGGKKRPRPEGHVKMFAACLLVTIIAVMVIQELSVRRGHWPEPARLLEMQGRGAPLYFPPDAARH